MNKSIEEEIEELLSKTGNAGAGDLFLTEEDEREIEANDPYKETLTKPKTIPSSLNKNQIPPNSFYYNPMERKKNPRNHKPTELIKYYRYLNYEEPELLEKNYENKDNDLVKAIKEVFGRDNTENLNITNVDTSGTKASDVETRLRNELLGMNEKLLFDRKLRIKNFENRYKKQYFEDFLTASKVNLFDDLADQYEEQIGIMENKVGEIKTGIDQNPIIRNKIAKNKQKLQTRIGQLKNKKNKEEKDIIKLQLLENELLNYTESLIPHKAGRKPEISDPSLLSEATTAKAVEEFSLFD